jgi:peptide subunit release factor 1 (eRF1)
MVHDTNFLKRYLVILADRKHAKFFTIYMKHFEEQGPEIVSSDVPKKTKDDNGRWGKVERHVRDHVHHHLRLVGNEAMHFLIQKRMKQLDGVIIGGHRELLHLTKSLLPSKLRQKVMGEFVTGMHVSTGDITNRLITELSL